MGLLLHWCLIVINALPSLVLSIDPTRKPKLKGKARYNWPHGTNQLSSAAFDNANIIYFLTKTTWLNDCSNRKLEVNSFFFYDGKFNLELVQTLLNFLFITKSKLKYLILSSIMRIQV